MNPRYFKFGSESRTKSLRWPKAISTMSSFAVIPEHTVVMHSNSSDLAMVCCMMPLRGSAIFFVSLGSSGVSAPKILSSFIVIQLFVEESRSL